MAKTSRCFLLFAIVSLLLASRSFTASATTPPVVVTLNVNTFISMDLDIRIVDFERMVQGEVKEDVPPQGLQVTCKSNDPDAPWYLKISDTSPLTYGPDTIPNSHFYWYGYSSGSGTWYGTGEDNLSTAPVLAYSSPSSGLNLPGGTVCQFKFKLELPPDQEPGPYSTTVQFTMTE
ncbi:MAG: hypothetical protein NT030_05455 [Candidatus Saganbacteria bacterium]|nr:hypothetical protein [Candidatus Saganbacteria bacterium]